MVEAPELVTRLDMMLLPLFFDILFDHLPSTYQCRAAKKRAWVLAQGVQVQVINNMAYDVDNTLSLKY